MEDKSGCAREEIPSKLFSTLSLMEGRGGVAVSAVSESAAKSDGGVAEKNRFRFDLR